MPEENEAFWSSDTAGKLDKVSVAVLHDTGADHAGIPGPFDKDICQNDVLDVNAEQRNDGEYHDLAGEGKHYIYHAHDQLFGNAAEITGEKSHQGPQADGAEHGQDGKAEGRADAVDHAGEDTTSQVIGAQRILFAEVGKFVENVGSVRVMRGNDRGKDAHQSHDQHQRDGTNSSFIMKKTV